MSSIESMGLLVGVSRLAVGAAAWAFLLFASPATAMDERVVVDHFAHWSRLNALAQTPDGYLWIGTDAGLIRYDGIRFFTAASTHNNLPSNNVTKMAVGSDGGLWFALEKGGRLFRLRPGSHVPEDVLVSLGDEAIRALAETAAGTLWIDSTRGLYTLDTRGLLKVEDDLVAGNTNGTLAADGKRLWLGLAGGLAVWRDGRFHPSATLGPLLAIAPDGDGGAFALPTDKPPVHVSQGGTVTQLPGFDALGLDDGGTMERAGDALVVVCKQGIAWWAAGKWHGQAVGSASRLLVDREGSWWLGRQKGVLRRMDVPVFRVLEKDRADPAIMSIVQSGDEVWLGSPFRVVRIAEPRLEIDYGAKGGTSPIRSIARSVGGGIWVGATESGLYRVTNGKNVAVDPLSDSSDGFVSAIYEDSKGLLWLGTRGLDVFDGRTFRHLDFPKVPCAEKDCRPWVTSIIGDKDETIWIATRNLGLFRYRGGSFRHWGSAEGLSDRLTELHLEDDGTLWIGTEGAGLGRIVDERAQVVGGGSGFPADSVFGIIEDGVGNLWMGIDQGIVRARKIDLERLFIGDGGPLALVRFDGSDGIAGQRFPLNYHPSALRDTKGRLWFATSGGAVVFSPPEKTKAPPAPSVIIEQVTLDGSPQFLNPEKDVTIPSNGREITVQYAAPSFVAPRRIRFQHRLAGHKDTWSPPTDARVASFVNLEPGTYLLQVRASLDDLDWSSAETALRITVKSFYTQPVVLALGVLGLILILGIGHGIRMGLLRTRFRSVLDERNRIARDLHDSLAQYLTGIGFQLEKLAIELRDNVPIAERTLKETKEILMRFRLEARQSVWNLRSEGLGQRTLAESIGEMARQVRLGGNADVSVNVVGGPWAISDKTQRELIRIAQEATANALVHGRASNVLITLAFDERALRMAIDDDGAGFSPSDADSDGGAHFGLAGIRERCERVGGTVTVDSRFGEGARIEVTIAKGTPDV